MEDKIDWIVSSINNDNVISLDDYIDKRRREIFNQIKYVRPLVISNKMLEFLISIGQEEEYSKLSYYLSMSGNLKQLQRVLPLLDHDSYIDILSQLINKLSHNYDPYTFLNGIGPPESQVLNMRLSILEFINFLSDKLTLRDISEILNQSQVRDIDRNSYVVNDIILYILFRAINDELLQSSDPDFIEEFALLSLYNNSSQTLIDMLFKYVPNPQEIIDDVNHMILIVKPNNYVSFFEEDI